MIFLNRLCVVTGAFLQLICMTDGINEADWTIYQNWRDWMNYQCSQSLELDGSFTSEPLQGDAAVEYIHGEGMKNKASLLNI